MRLKTIALTTSLIAIAGAAWCRSARAEDAPGGLGEDKRPTAALAACASGDVQKGIAILGELYAETRNPAFVFNQARCYQKNNQLEQARASFSEYLRIGVNEPAEDLQRAQGYVKEIDDSLARQRAAAPAPTPIVVAPAGNDGERKHTLRVASIVLAGVGVAAIAAGAVMSLKVKGINDDINGQFAGQDYVTDVPALQQKVSDGERYETWQWVGYGIGIAAMAGAATTFILSTRGSTPEQPAVAITPVLAPGGMGGVVGLRF